MNIDLKVLCEWIEDIQNAAGDGCHLEISVRFPRTLELRFSWTNGDKHFYYARPINLQELQYIHDQFIFIRWIINKARSEYERVVTQ